MKTNKVTLNNRASNKRIAVVGGGVIGVCCSLFLQQQGFHVTIFDKHGLAEGCSKGNAGHFATEQVFPLADKALLKHLPRMMLDPLGPISIRLGYVLRILPWFMRFMGNMRSNKFFAHTEALKALNKVAIECYLPLIERAGIQHLFVKNGSLLTFESTDKKGVVDMYQAYLQQGINLQILNREQIVELEPNISSNVIWALYFKDVAHTSDPYLFVQGLAKLFLSQGGEFYQREVRSISHQDDGVRLLTQQEAFHFDKVVIAAGAWSKSLIAPLGYRLPLDTERGYHLMLKQPNSLFRPVASAERKFIMTPMLGGLRLAGTVEFAGLEAPLNQKRAYMLYPQAAEILDVVPEIATQDSCWMGCRPSLPDSLPVIGQAPFHQHIFFALGHHHLGLTQGAVTGQLVAQLVAGKATLMDVSPFCISRFS